MLLVTGATGTIGRPLIDLLIGEGLDVRAVSRDPAVAGLPEMVEVVAGDPSRPESIASHLRGVTALVLNPAAVGLAAADLLRLARDQGVRRVVALSANNVDDDLAHQPSRFRGTETRRWRIRP